MMNRSNLFMLMCLFAMGCSSSSGGGNPSTDGGTNPTDGSTTPMGSGTWGSAPASDVIAYASGGTLDVYFFTGTATGMCAFTTAHPASFPVQTTWYEVTVPLPTAPGTFPVTKVMIAQSASKAGPCTPTTAVDPNSSSYTVNVTSVAGGVFTGSIVNGKDGFTATFTAPTCAATADPFPNAAGTCIDPSTPKGDTVDHCAASPAVACAADTDCPGGYRCDTAASSKVCVKLYCLAQGQPCTDPVQCASGLTCETSTEISYGKPCAKFHQCVGPGTTINGSPCACHADCTSESCNLSTHMCQ